MRLMYLLVTCGLAACAAAFTANPTANAQAEQAPVQRQVELFPLNAVRLLDGPFKHAQDTNLRYLLAHDADRMLAPFRREAGLEMKAEPYGNWESMGLDGHSAGHYLTALALSYAATGDAEAKRRLDDMVDELAEIQDANGNGYVGGVPNSDEVWSSLASGDLKVTGFGLQDAWVPWYNVHKTYAGLRDAYLLADNEKAKDVLVGFADWALELTGQLSDEQMQQMLDAEHGGMNEVLADVAAITGDDKYLAFARRFSHRDILDPLIEGRDDLTGKHANTQIPKVIGFERIAHFEGGADWHAAAVRFWETVVDGRSVAIGGNSVDEHFNNPDDFGPMLESRTGPETCNTYNMLRLTADLFTAEPEAAYADYYERAVYNHILSSQHPETGGYVYFTPMRPRHYRVYSQAEQAFWCCVGSGFENHAKYGRFVYGHAGDDDLFVNLFIASELDWADRGVTVRQETSFPDEPSTTLTLEMEAPATFALNVRHPAWATGGDFAVSVNGERQTVDSQPGSYATLEREWADGDTVEVELPMHLAAERLPDGSNNVAFRYGPIVLAAATGDDELRGVFAGSGRGDHVANGPLRPMVGGPTLVTDDPADLAARLRPVDGEPLTFTLDDEVMQPNEFDGLTLRPFFRTHEVRYVLYFPVESPADYAARQEQLAAAEEVELALERATVDRVVPGAQQTEVEHNFEGERTNQGSFRDRNWRDATGWFSYTLALPDDGAPADLHVDYFGGNRGRRFDILLDGEVFQEVRISGEHGDEFYTVRYPLPDDLGDTVDVRFEARDGSIAGGVFDLRVVRREEGNAGD